MELPGDSGENEGEGDDDFCRDDGFGEFDIVILVGHNATGVQERPARDQ